MPQMGLTIKYLQQCGHNVRPLPPGFVAIPEEEVGFLMVLDSCREFIRNRQNADTCHWCGKEEKMPRKGLCRHCNRVQRDIARLEKLVASDPTDFFLNYEAKIARQKKRDCTAWGQRRRNILDGPVSPLTLEHWFRDSAKQIARDERMFFGSANFLGSVFAPEQRQVLAYRFWEMLSAQASHNRHNRAMGAASREERREQVTRLGGDEGLER